VSDTLRIDWTRCAARGACVELLPELLVRDDWGYPLPTDGGSTAAVPRARRRDAREAARTCPRLALRLEHS
jgi:ferredoxin